MPTDGCSVCMPIIIVNSKLSGAKQDSVPYMMKVILSHIPVECGVVGPYVDIYNLSRDCNTKQCVYITNVVYFT